MVIAWTCARTIIQESTPATAHTSSQVKRRISGSVSGFGATVHTSHLQLCSSGVASSRDMKIPRRARLGNRGQTAASTRRDAARQLVEAPPPWDPVVSPQLRYLHE